MAATQVLFTAQDKTATVNAFTTTTVTPHTGGLQVIMTSAIGSVNSEAQPAVTIASGLTGQGTITAISGAGVGGAATTTGCWAFFVKSNTGTVVPGTYTVTFTGGSLPTAFSVTIIEYQAGDWDSTLGTPIINGCSSTVVTTAPTATLGSAPATTSRCGAWLASRNKTTALGVGTSPWTILAGTDEHQAATPSASSIFEERTGTASTLVDGSSWGATGNAIIGWEVPAPAATSVPVQPGAVRRKAPPRRKANTTTVTASILEQVAAPAQRSTRRRTAVGLRVRRNTAPVPAQVVVTAPALPLAPVRRHTPLLPKLQRRPAPAPVPAQVVVAGLVYPLPPVRRRRPLPPPVRDRQAPQTVNAPQPFPGIVRRRTAPLAKVQRRALTPVPAPVVLAAPAFVPQPARRRLPLPHMSVRRLVTPVPDQVVVAVAGIVFAPVRRARLVLAKLTRRAPQVTPAPVVYVPVLNRRRRTLPPVVRDRQAPVPPPTVAALVGQPKRRRQPAPKLTRRAIRDIYANTTAPVVVGGGYAGIGVGVGPSAAMGTATGAAAGPGAAIGATAGPSAATGPTAGVGAGTGPTAKPS